MKINLDTLEDTERSAVSLAKQLEVGDVILLKGEVGAGKTTFSRFLINALQARPEEVTSPTFTLVQPYDVNLANGEAAIISHYDLYRLEDASELREIGLEDALEQGVALIEWPEIAGEQAFGEALHLYFSLDTVSQERALAIQADGAWQLRAESWSSDYAKQRGAA